MSSDTRLPPRGERPSIPSILSHPRRRRLLSDLLSRGGPLTYRDLAVRLAADEAGGPTDQVTEREYRRLATVCYHRDVPMLARAGLVDRRPEGVVPTDRATAEDVARLLRDPSDVEESTWEAIAAIRGRPRRRDAVSIVAGRDGPLSLDDLAAALAERGHGPAVADDEDDLDLRAKLYHMDLPALADAGLIEYDDAARIVSPAPALDAIPEEACVPVEDAAGDAPGPDRDGGPAGR